MLPSRHFGDLKPESWLGLLDATYAIIMTLMVIDLPSLVTALIDHFQGSHDSFLLLIRVLCFHVLGYMAMFMIIYEIWSIHRSTLTISQPSRHKTIFTGAILAVSSFMPPLVQMANGYRQTYVLSGDQQGWAIVETIRAVLYLLLLLIYFMLYVSAKPSVPGPDESAASLEANRSLFSLAAVARNRCILALVIYPLSLIFPVGGPFYLLLFVLIGYFGLDLLRFGRRGLALVAPGR
jgi:uncharacterized membrane protein